MERSLEYSAVDPDLLETGHTDQALIQTTPSILSSLEPATVCQTRLLPQREKPESY